MAAVVIVAPLMLLRDFTPDNELRYLSIADEAIRNGSVFAFSNHGVPYADKPPLYLWLLMACRWLLGGWHTWLLGLFSLVPSLITVCVMERWTRGCMPAARRLPTMAALITTGMFLGSALVLRMDALMTMFIVLAVRKFHMLYSMGGQGERETSVPRSFSFSFPLLLFLALFTKGPLGIIIPLAGTTLFLAMKKELRRWPEFFGLKTWIVIGGLSALWFLGVYLEGGSKYLDNLVFHQTVDRAVNAFHHKRPLWYYCVAALYSFAPWTLLIGGVVIMSVKQRLIRTDIERLFLAMSVATFTVLTCISSKLAIYLLPMLPFTVCLTMTQLRHHENKALARLCLAVPAAMLAAALPVAIIMFPHDTSFGFMKSDVMPAVTVATAMGAAACYMVSRCRQLCNIIMVMACGMGLTVLAAGLSISKINPSIGHGAACREAESMARKHGVPILVDRNIKNAADMDVYLKRFTLVDENRIDTVNGTKRVVLITRGEGVEKLKSRLVSASLKQPHNNLSDNALRNRQFHPLKQAVLMCKSACFRSQNKEFQKMGE